MPPLPVIIKTDNFQAPQFANANQIEYVCPSSLQPDSRNSRRHTRAQVRAIGKSLDEFGFNAPLLIGRNNTVIVGHGRLSAAILLKLAKVPIIRLDHLSETKARAYMIADNKLSDRSSFDETKLALELRDLTLHVSDLDIDAIGFEQAERDLLIQGQDSTDPDTADDFETPSAPPVTRINDLWSLGIHRLICANALDARSYAALLRDEQAAIVFTDFPYNVPIQGHVRGKGKRRHGEFVMASGELAGGEFQDFLKVALGHSRAFCRSGALLYSCMDWRHMQDILAAASVNGLELINVCVWVKTNGGMGSMYRSRHEEVFVFKNGKSAHINNVQLGRYGRNRTNVWNYPGANGFARKNSIDDFDSHPTVKPVRLVEDAILDSTHRSDVVLDPFLGSGTTILAAERTGRRGFGIELDPVHVDTAIRRWERMTGQKALNHDGLSFEEVAASRVNGVIGGL